MLKTRFISVGTYISYSIPIFLRLLRGKDFVPGPFNLGRYYFPIGIISVLWMTIASISLMLPTQRVVYDPTIYKSISEYIWHCIDVFNWAPVMGTFDQSQKTVIGVYAGATLIWYMSAREWFTGPRVAVTLEHDLPPSEEDPLIQDC